MKNDGYSKTALNALSKGQYKALRTNSLASRKREDARKRVPEVKKTKPVNLVDPNKSDPSPEKNPSKRYTNETQKGFLDGKINDYAKAHPIISTLNSVSLAPGVALEGIESALGGIFGQKAYDQITGKKFGKNNSVLDARTSVIDPLSATKSKEGIRQGVLDQIDSGVGKFAYNTATGLADMGANLAMAGGSPVAMGVISGSQNAAQNTLHAMERGVDEDKARKTGLATGVVAGLMNSVGLDSVLKSTAKTVAGQVLQGAGKEGLENVVEDIADTWIDNLINKENSEYNKTIQYYVQNGMTEEEAYKKSFVDYLNQELASFASGAALGGLIGGGKKAIPSLLNSRADVQAQPDVTQNAQAFETTKVPDVVENAKAQAERAQAEIERLNQQIPEVPEEAPIIEETVANQMQAAGESAPIEELNNTGIEGNPTITESVKAEDIKLVRNKETGEYSYDNYRVVKTGKQGYEILDADGNSVGTARTLNDAKAVISDAQNSVESVEEPTQPLVPTAQNTEVAPVENNAPMVNGGGVANVPPTDVGNVEGVNGRHTKTSQAYTNTGKRGKGWTAQEYKDHTNASQFQYEDISEQESINRAASMLEKEGLDGFKDRVMDKDRLSSDEIDALMMEWRIIGQQARMMEAAGEDATDAWNESVRVFRKIQEQSTSNAQALQALAKWSRNTPEGMLSEAENIINGKQKSKGPDKSPLQKAFEKFSKSNKKFKFSDEFAVEFQKKAQDLEGLDPESFEARLKMAELGRMINRQLPSNLGEKAMTILMDNMLGNFRTLITRNAGGNVGLNAVEQLAQRPLAALIDMGVSKKTGKRTQAGLSGKGLAEYLNGFTKGIIEEYIDFKNNIHTARSGENTLEKAIESNRHVFKENGVMDKLDKLVKHGLSIGDRPFYEAVYNQTLGDYQRMRTKGQMGDDIQRLSDEDFDMYAKTAAKMNALSAVYQQDSKMAKALLNFKSAVGDLSKGIVGVDILSQFSMPFVKTPANVVERAIDYSPLGFVRNIARTAIENKAGEFDQNRFANETARNILGTALMAGSGALANKGVMSGGYSDDTDEKQAQKEAGMQEYALNLPGESQMDISWIPVVGSNAVSAAAAVDAYNRGEGNALANMAKGIEAGGQSLFDQSMFQGLQRLFGTGETYNSDTGIVGNMANVVKSGVGQAIPSLLRQANQVADPYQRDLSNSNKEASFGMFNNYDLNSLANNIPVLRQLGLAPKVNTSGELVKENQGRNIGSKILEDMILPGKITKVDYSDLNKEAARLKEATTSADAYMPKASRKYIDTEEHTLTNDEWVQYQQDYYKSMTEVGNKLMESEAYKAAKPEDQVKILKTGYDAIKYALQSEYNGKEVSGAAKAYKEAGGGEAGIEAVINKVTSSHNPYGLDSDEYDKAIEEGQDLSSLEGYKQALDATGLDNKKAYQEAYKEGGEQALNQMVSDKDMFKKQFNLDAPAVVPTWQKAKTEFPQLTPNEFDKQFREIAGMSEKGDKMAIAQDEITAYVNKHPEIYKKNGEWDMDAINKLWSGFGSDSWAYVPYVKKDGSVGKHKEK